jgi:hypothetical protein
VDGTVTLEHNDRIRLAENNYYRFIDPAVTKTKPDDDNQADDAKYDYTFLREEALKELGTLRHCALFSHYLYTVYCSHTVFTLSISSLLSD